MPTVTTIRPDAKLQDDGYVNESGGTATHVKVQDKSDTTWIKKGKTTSQSFVTSLANPATARPQSTEFVWYSRVRARMACTSGGNLLLKLGSTTSGKASSLTTVASQTGAKSLPSTISITSSTMTAGGAGVLTVASHSFVIGDWIVVASVTGANAAQYNGTWQVTAVTTTTISFTGNSGAGGAGTGGTVQAGWNMSGNLYGYPGTGLLPSQTNINDLTLSITDNATTTAARSTIYETWVDVVTTPLPTVALTSIDGDTTSPYSVANTTRPTIVWTYSQSDGVDYGGSVVKIFSASTADPETTTANLVWSTTTAANADTQATVGVDLQNSLTYWLYIKVGSDPTGLFDGKHNAWSTWLSTSFAVSLTAPSTPSIGGASPWDSATSRATFTLTGSAFAAGTQTFELQRSTDSGVTWSVVRNCAALVPNGSNVATAVDYEAPRPSTTVRYRVRSNGLNSGVRVSSAWSTNYTLNTTSDSKWQLVDVTNPESTTTGTRVGVKVLEGVNITQSETLGVFRPLGRSKPIVVHGDLEGYDGSYQVLCNSDTEFAQVLAIINCQRTVLVRSAFGDQKYVRFTDRSWSKSGSVGSPLYTISVSYVEVESGETAG